MHARGPICYVASTTGSVDSFAVSMLNRTRKRTPERKYRAVFTRIVKGNVKRKIS